MDSDPRYHDKAGRSVNRDSLNAEINRRLAAPRPRHWIEQFNAGGVACGLINDVRAVFEEPQVQHLQMVKEVECAPGPQRLVGQPMQLERTPSSIVRAAPRAASIPKKCWANWARRGRAPAPARQ
jgi:crotonobetainyl-CoA:carnitine CoA-transferase CaiB-like acyl-CoA transferase